MTQKKEKKKENGIFPPFFQRTRYFQHLFLVEISNKTCAYTCLYIECKYLILPLTFVCIFLSIQLFYVEKVKISHVQWNYTSSIVNGPKERMTTFTAKLFNIFYLLQ